MMVEAEWFVFDSHWDEKVLDTILELKENERTCFIYMHWLSLTLFPCSCLLDWGQIFVEIV